MKKKLLIFLTLLLAVLIAFAVFHDQILDLLHVDRSGWKENDGATYYLDEGGAPRSGWLEIEGSRYYFSPNGGAMQTGWLTLGGARYYLGANGVMQTGWVEVGGMRCYLAENGALATGWTQIDGKRCYLDENGCPVSGWLDTDGGTFYLNADGTAATGWLDADDCRYYLDENGSKSIGWLELEDGAYYMDENGSQVTGWTDIDGLRYYFGKDGRLVTGWADLNETRYYFGEDGAMQTGWLDTDEGRYYLGEDGRLVTGWLTLDGNVYYILPDGTLAHGKQTIDGQTHFFTGKGEEILLVNPWNLLPDDYSVELVTLSDGHEIAKSIEEPLQQMLSGCKAAGHNPYLYSAFRTASHQQQLFNNMWKNYKETYSSSVAYQKASQIVAIPGTSEHQLGLAVDITDASYRKLDHAQEKTETQKWLMEHCWEYGFILRYPSSKSTVTGIIYEPWHYRYVGVELAMELKSSGLCLEEYLDVLTGDGTTCGGKA